MPGCARRASRPRTPPCTARSRRDLAVRASRPGRWTRTATRTASTTSGCGAPSARPRPALTFDRPAVGDPTLYPSDHFGLAARVAVAMTDPIAPLRLAHRGDWRVAPENSLEALVAAMRVPGCDGVEFDVRMSARRRSRSSSTIGRSPGSSAAPERRARAGRGRSSATWACPRLAEVLAALPDAWMDMELKGAAHGDATAASCWPRGARRPWRRSSPRSSSRPRWSRWRTGCRAGRAGSPPMTSRPATLALAIEPWLSRRRRAVGRADPGVDGPVARGGPGGRGVDRSPPRDLRVAGGPRRRRLLRGGAPRSTARRRSGAPDRAGRGAVAQHQLRGQHDRRHRRRVGSKRSDQLLDREPADLLQRLADGGERRA